jgi:uncharacterized protein (TIGR00369 family)
MSKDPASEGWKKLPMDAGFEHHIGPLWSKLIAPGRMRFGFLAGPHHVNPYNVVHGGMLVTFADHVMGALVWYVAGKKPCTTVTLNSDFASSARVGDWIEGEAWLVRKGRSLIFVRGEISVEARVVLAATGVWKVMDGQ